MSSRALSESACIVVFHGAACVYRSGDGTAGAAFRPRSRNTCNHDLRTFPLRTSWDRIDRLLARDHPGVSDKGRTVARLHGERRPRAVVLLHGMSSSPPQFDRFSRDLFARGHNVLVPRLPRHGHSDRLSTALARLRPDDLYAGVDEYISIARELGERVTVAGFSLGGLLAAWSAQHYRVDRCVAIAPFFGVAWIPTGLMTAVAETMLRIPNNSIGGIRFYANGKCPNTAIRAIRPTRSHTHTE